MTKDDIIRMAREAGFTGYDSLSERLHEFAALVAAAEREAIVLLIKDNDDADGVCCTDDVLAAIRARGQA